MTKRPRQNSQAAPPTNPQTFLERDNWMRALLGSDEPCAAVRIGIAIALHLNVKTGRCDPGHKTLKKDTGMSGETTRSVERWVARLVRDGWLAIKRGGGGHTNSYVLTRQHVADQELNQTRQHVADQELNQTRQQVADQADSDPPLLASDPPLSDDQTRHIASSDPPHAGGQKERKAKREKGKRKSPARCARETDKTPDFDFAGKADASRKTSPADDGAAFDVNAAFERFWAVYPKRVGIDGARKAWARVIKNAADAETAIKAAKRYAIERRGEQARYTLNPENFLKAGRWKDPPPDGLVLDGVSGEPVVIEQPPPRRDNRDKSQKEVAAELLAELEADEPRRRAEMEAIEAELDEAIYEGADWMREAIRHG